MMCGGPDHQKETHLQIPLVEDQEGLRYMLLTDNVQKVTFSSARKPYNNYTRIPCFEDDKGQEI